MGAFFFKKPPLVRFMAQLVSNPWGPVLLPIHLDFCGACLSIDSISTPLHNSHISFGSLSF